MESGTNTMVFCRSCGLMYVAEVMGMGDVATRMGGYQFAGPECKGCKTTDYEVLTPRRSNRQPYPPRGGGGGRPSYYQQRDDYRQPRR